MFSDSHTHFFHIFSKNNEDFSILREMEQKKFRFIMDIGTEAGDLQRRKSIIKKGFDEKEADFIHFTAGLWPSAEQISEPEKAMQKLRDDIESHLKTNPKYSAIGECGLDRYWNGAEALEKGRTGGTQDIEGEEFLFKEQLRYAKEKKLAVVIHSRDAFADTLKCIDEVGHHQGIIHCYSYGIEEAKPFIERGWYISFPGTISYAKKQADKDRIADLVKSVPKKQFLLETDAPYLAPAPFRGKMNTPLLIEYTYSLASEILNISMNELADLVYENCCECFKIG